jgi:hypothetical protein
MGIQSMLISKRHYNLLESELEYYRKLARQERERADRLHDLLLTHSGMPPTTDTVLESKKKFSSELEQARKEQEMQLAEMFSETMDSHSDLDLPSELREDAEKMMTALKE